VLSPSFQVLEHGQKQLVFREDTLLAAIDDGLAVAHQILHGEEPKTAKKPEPDKGEAAELSGCHLVRLLPDGSRGEYYPVGSRGLTIGKKGTSIVFPEDPMIANLHASVTRRTGKHVLRDEDSATGVFYQLPSNVNTTVNRGDLVRLGGQFLVFDTDENGAWARHYDSKGNEGKLYPITDETLILGTLAPDCLDTDDPTLAQRHLALRTIAGTIQARDLGSEAGSYLRVMRDLRLKHGDIFMVGKEHIMFVDQKKERELAQRQKPVFKPEPTPDRVEVIFDGNPKPVPAGPGQCLLDVARMAGVEVDAQCCNGACGSDPVEILEGMKFVDPHIDPLEAETLKHICDLTPGPYRLACKLRVHGPVKVKFVKPTHSN